MKNLIALFTITLIFNIQSLMGQCESPVTMTTIENDGINYTIGTGQLFFNNFDTYTAGHEFPAGSNTHLYYSAGLWIAGLDPNNQLHIAAAQYDNNGDYYPGPLSTDGTATQTNCDSYDQFFTVTRQAAYIHYLYFLALEAGTEDIDFPDGYVIPQEILNYPGNGDIALGEAEALAPFYDYDGDGQYIPENGDFPFFDQMNLGVGCTPCNSLGGDVATFWINNDAGAHEETSGNQLGVEIHNTTFTFNNVDGTPAENSTFFHKKIINRSDVDYSEVYVSILADTDIGNPDNDFLGCTTEKNLGYAYNGSPYDASTNILGYEENPPAAGIVILEGPLATPNNLDDDGDGVIDNEHLEMTNFMFFNTTGAGTSDPQEAFQYYNYMQSIWKDGSPLTYGGNGYIDNTGITTNFAYPDDYILEGEEEWSEISAANQAGDRRMLISIGPFNLAAGEEVCIKFASVVGLGENNIQSIDVLQDNTDYIINQYENCFHEILTPLDEIDDIVSIEDINPIISTIQMNANNLLTVTSSHSKTQSLEIINALGQTVISDTFISSYSNELNLTKGIYIVNVFDQSNTTTKKIIVN